MSFGLFFSAPDFGMLLNFGRTGWIVGGKVALEMDDDGMTSTGIYLWRVVKRLRGSEWMMVDVKRAARCNCFSDDHCCLELNSGVGGFDDGHTRKEINGYISH